MSQRPLLVVFGDRNCAAAVAIARVLAGAPVVARFTATLPLAVVLAFAIMPGRCRTSALALALVHASANMLLAAFSCPFLSNYTASLRTGKNPSYSTEQQFVEISSFHTHPGTLHKPRKRHVCPARDRDTQTAARYAAYS